ncbi:sigma-70 family RNA polymerase sigma factor [Streptomyces sp. E11-3]
MNAPRDAAMDATDESVDERELAERFEEHRPHLRAVAYRMLGSLSEAEDAVQEAWIRLSRTDTSEVQNLGGWLTTVVGRVCLNMLRSRTARREEPLEVHIPDPIVSRVYSTDGTEGADGGDPERAALLTDSVGLAMLVVLDTLAPAERLAFVLHDLFAVPFDAIAPVVERTTAATRQLASRARRRVQGQAPAPAPERDLTLQRKVVDAFLAAARDGDFETLVSLLDPDVVLRADSGSAVPAGTPWASKLVRGAATVATHAMAFRWTAGSWHLVLVNGSLGVVTAPGGKPMAIAAYTISRGKIVAMDILADPARLPGLGLADLIDQPEQGH